MGFGGGAIPNPVRGSSRVVPVVRVRTCHGRRITRKCPLELAGRRLLSAPGRRRQHSIVTTSAMIGYRIHYVLGDSLL